MSVDGNANKKLRLSSENEMHWEQQKQAAQNWSVTNPAQGKDPLPRQRTINTHCKLIQLSFKHLTMAVPFADLAQHPHGVSSHVNGSAHPSSGSWAALGQSVFGVDYDRGRWRARSHITPCLGGTLPPTGHREPEQDDIEHNQCYLGSATENERHSGVLGLHQLPVEVHQHVWIQEDPHWKERRPVDDGERGAQTLPLPPSDQEECIELAQTIL